MDGQRFYEFIYHLVTLDSDYFGTQEIWLTNIFPSVFWVTFLCTLLICSIYYNVINNLTARLGYVSYWLLFMMLTGGVAFYLAVSKAATEIFIGVTLGSAAWLFAANNFIVACLLYFLFSLVLKTRKISTYADHVPFKTPW
jgi:hypothetical protein